MKPGMLHDLGNYLIKPPGKYVTPTINTCPGRDPNTLSKSVGLGSAKANSVRGLGWSFQVVRAGRLRT